MAKSQLQLIELYQEALHSIVASPENWLKFLESAGRNYRYPFQDQLMIHYQHPNAVAVLELSQWNRRFGRWVNRGATGIAAFGRRDGRTYVKYYFDVTDTHPGREDNPVPLWSVEQDDHGPILSVLEQRYETTAPIVQVAVFEAAKSSTSAAISAYWDKIQDARLPASTEQLRSLLENSTAYLLLHRLDMMDFGRFYPQDFDTLELIQSPEHINLLGDMVSTISEGILVDIAAIVRAVHRNGPDFFARSKNAVYYEDTKALITEQGGQDYGTELQYKDWIQSSEPDAPGGTVSSRQVRNAAGELPTESSQEPVSEPADQREAESTHDGDPDQSHRDDGTVDAPASERGRDYGRSEAAESAGMGRTDEQPPAQRRGSDSERPDLQLTSFEHEIIDLDSAGGNTPPAFSYDSPQLSMFNPTDVVDMESNDGQLSFIVSSSDIKSKTIDLPEDYFMYHGISIDQQTYIYGENCVLKMDGSDMIPVCDFYLSGNLLCMIPQEDHIAAVTDCGLYRLTPSDNTTTAEVTTLTLGTMFRGYVQDEYIKSAIKAFNAAHSDVEIVAVDYMDGHATVAEATTALNLDIAAGCGPDLIDTVAFDYDTYIRNGTLISLDDRIQQDIDAEYFHPNLLSSLTLYGSVYAIMAGYQLDALSVHGEYLEMIGDNFTWSISGFSDQIDQAPENVCVLNCDPGTFLSLWCNNCIEDYIQNNTCNFDSDSFVQLLKTANKLSQTDAYDLYALNHVYIHSVQDYLLYLEINNRITGEFTNYSYIGFPSDNSNGVAFEQKIAIGISVQSKDPDLCWAFIKSLLEEDFQKQISVNMFSIRTDVLNNCILDAKSDDGRQFTDSQTEYFHELMDGIDHIYGVYPDVTAIVLEEASAYFTGDKTAEQVAQIVQNRVTIYLGEHY